MNIESEQPKVCDYLLGPSCSDVEATPGINVLLEKIFTYYVDQSVIDNDLRFIIDVSDGPLSSTPSPSLWTAYVDANINPNSNNNNPGTLCNSSNNLTSCSGAVADGSGSSNYNNNTDCEWLIEPNGNQSVTVNFNSFDLASGDYLYIYDGGSKVGTPDKSYSGSNIPPSFTAQSGKMLLHFVSNSSGTANGWSCSYSCNRKCYLILSMIQNYLLIHLV
ncbi:MAG: CUB domain-containing protein [Owenweeksia sp.]|nr:CUB domain-containing protein [Owenweeksia sp.]